MAKRKRKLPELTRRGQQVLAHVLTVVALGSHDDSGDLESIARELGLTPGGLRPTLKKMEAAGLDQGDEPIEIRVYRGGKTKAIGQPLATWRS